MYNHNFLIPLLAFITCLFQGCTASPEEDTPSPLPSEVEYPIILSTPAHSRSDNLLQDAGVTHFEIVAWKERMDGTMECVLGSDNEATDPYTVQYQGGQWVYEGVKDGQYLKYWDLSTNKYFFSAYALKSSLADPPTKAVMKKGQLSVTHLKGNTTTEETLVYECYYCRDNRNSTPMDYDLLASETEPFYTPLATNSRPSMADIVPLRFHQVMSKVVFKIYVTGNVAGKDLTVSDFKAVAHGTTHPFVIESDYTFPSNFNTSAYNNPAFAILADVDPGVIAGTSSATAATLVETYQIPQNINDSTAEITVVLGGKTYSTTINLFQNSTNNRWDKDTLYTYILVLSMDEDIILVDVQLSPWIVGGETQTEQDNW